MQKLYGSIPPFLECKALWIETGMPRQHSSASQAPVNAAFESDRRAAGSGTGFVIGVVAEMAPPAAVQRCESRGLADPHYQQSVGLALCLHLLRRHGRM